MGMPDLARTWTLEEVLALPEDGCRHELVDGELLVTPAPRGRHQRAVWTLFPLLRDYVRAHRLGCAGLAPADLDLGQRQRVQPDLFVGRLVDGRDPVEWHEWGVPLLVAEILSPSTASTDRNTKRRLYLRAGVPICWLVDLDARRVEVWTPDAAQPDVVAGSLRWQPNAAMPPLSIDLPDLFREILIG